MKNKYNMFTDLKNIFSLIGEYKNKMLMYFILANISNSIITIAFSFATKCMIDYFIEEIPNSLSMAIISIGTAIVAGGIFLPIFFYLASMIKAKIINNIRINLFSHMQSMPATYFENHHSGDTLARVNKDINALELSLNTIENFISRMVSILMAIPYILILDYRIGLIALVLGLLSMWFNLKFRLPMREKSREVHKKSAVLTEQLTENVTGFNVIKTYDLSEKFFNKYIKRVDEVIENELKINKLNAFLYSSNSLIGWFGRGGIALIGCYFVIKNTMTAGTLMGSIFVASNLSWSLITIGEMLATVQKSLAGSDRIYEILNEPSEPESYKINGVNNNSGLAIKNGYFSYDNEDNVINDLNFEVKKGQIAALVGYSGGGKSTIVKLILGLYPLEKGLMTVNGKAISDYTLEELRDNLAYVPQNAYVFNGTIKENILYGRSNATQDEIISAAKKANAHDFIMEQVDKYETVVGERGIKLSGGQRQRVAIARAILKDAPILLLDEATSSLDTESEVLIQQALLELMKDRTSLVVAHRLSTIEHADIIFFIEDGMVKEQGTHIELLTKKEKYHELYKREFSQK